ncbi:MULTISPECIES: hypothetical protein [unclassified Streptomyces]|uniref:hypothetical protein n=1 Tax=unclassified Streptomyces TaxID=2593676 RepID=UPI0022516FDB|nr:MULTISPECIES: hypothetical protein [unclassified Streptomyces]WSP56359.1 hypothetical protein OG306_19775 [Streptomyces sp. NBC_01241]MCX4788087.1 hypothetical protein [Streptomyces sp. NBC_01221]MCX4796152.1 hypothetical protein [Streptomyces sp. NBC_01242]WSJ37409.1 hypothetical protein OG772_16140 [Streptomyces sp. NBC_01321]WSP63806.1 hypothetical protein OG466_19355 [Streptomyces sp. NBC_01240]
MDVDNWKLVLECWSRRRVAARELLDPEEAEDGQEAYGYTIDGDGPTMRGTLLAPLDALASGGPALDAIAAV